MNNKKRILILPGDGIGPEVSLIAKKLLMLIDKKFSLGIEISEGLIGGIAYEEYGQPLPNSTLSAAKNADAVLLGAVGGPRWENIDFSLRPERALLGLRSSLKLYANLRPAKIFQPLVDASPLKKRIG